MADITSDAASGGGGSGGGAHVGDDGTGTAVVDDVPALVRVLAGNPATSAAVLACLNTIDASCLRRLHPAVEEAVAGVPWADMGAKVADAVWWRAAFPAAVGVWVSQLPADGCLAAPALAALVGITNLSLVGCECVTDELLQHLPASLCVLTVNNCRGLTERASFGHLAALVTLNCCGTRVVACGVAGLPASLEVLITDSLPASVSLAGLTRLQMLHAEGTHLNAITLASLPPSLLVLHAARCYNLALGASFAHLPLLHALVVSHTGIGDAALATLPRSLVFLDVFLCENLTPAAVLPHLPALRLLNASRTRVGDALVASLPMGLEMLYMVGCRCVTGGATLDHVPVLQTLHSMDTELAPSVLAACHARGCVVPVVGVLRGHQHRVLSLALLTDGRLASGDSNGVITLWDVAAGGSVVGAVHFAGSGVTALAALRDGHRLAAAVNVGVVGEYVAICEMGVVPPVRATTVDCRDSFVHTLVVLRDGRLAAGCDDGELRIIDADAGTGAVVATLEGHNDGVTSLAVLPDGALASGSDNGTVRVWDVDARACVAMLAGHGGCIRVLAALADGRLASGSDGSTVQLWDVGTRTCVGVLAGHTDAVSALAALPDGRLVSGSDDGSVRVWDTRPVVSVAGIHAAVTVPMVVVAHGLRAPSSLVPLPDGRLACSGGCDGAVYLLNVPPPVVYE